MQPADVTSFERKARPFEDLQNGLTPTAYLERRVGAAAVDALIVTLSCLGLLFAFNTDWHPLPAWVGWASAAVILLYTATEALTGLTPGKRLLALRVRRDGGSPAAPPSRGGLLARALLKVLPVVLLLPVLLASQSMMVLIALTAFVTLVA